MDGDDTDKGDQDYDDNDNVMWSMILQDFFYHGDPSDQKHNWDDNDKCDEWFHLERIHLTFNTLITMTPMLMIKVIISF